MPTQDEIQALQIQQQAANDAAQRANPQQYNLVQPGNINNATAANQQYQQAQQAARDQGGLQGSFNQQQNLYNQLAGQNGVANQGNVFNQQQQLANQLQGIASGQGPNPAQAMLNQQTGQNVSNQAALMAGQRGAGANAGLLARQIAQQGAATQQQAVGQGASLQAQQSLNALGALQGQQANMANLAATQVGQQQGALGQQASLANQLTQNNLNQQQLAQQQQQLQYGQLNNQNQMGLNQQQGVNQINAGLANTALQGQQNLANTGLEGALHLQQQGQQQTANLIGGLLQGAGGAATALLNQGGQVKRMADGGSVSGPMSNIGKILAGGLSGIGAGLSGNQNSMSQLGSSLGKGLVSAFSPKQASQPNNNTALGKFWDSAPELGESIRQFAKGGRIPALLSPGEVYVPPSKVKETAKGHLQGKKVPGKPKVKGDSLKNDTVPASLEEGGVVIPRSVMTSKNAPKNAAKFVQAILSRQGPKKRK